MPDRIGPIPFIYNAISEGLTATQALNTYRELGGAIRTQRFYHAFSEIAAEVAVTPSLQATPSEQPLSADVITQIGSNRPGGYLFRGAAVVSVRTVNPLTGQVTETTQLNFGMVKSSEILSPAQILAELESKFGTEGQSGLANSTVIGSFITAANELVPPEE